MTWRFRGAAWTITAAMLVAFAAGCGDDDDDDDGGNGGDGGGDGGGTQVDPDPLNLDIQAATFPAGGPPTVTFRVTDQAGTAIDVPTEIGRANVSPAGLPNLSPRFTFAMLDQFGDYRSYYQTNRAVDPAWTQPADLPLPTPPRPPNAAPGATTQASGTSGPSATAPFDLTTLESLGNGVYRFTLPAVTAGVTGLDRARTHTIAGWVVRTKEGGDQDIAFDSFNFLPDGAGTVELDQVISDEGCNKCHGVVQAHGTRRGTQICLTCHSPQTSDPETGRVVDFKVMIHKIHAGGTLASVQADRTGGTLPYYIVGNRLSVHDWSEVAFPWHDGVSHCTACHVGEDANNWRTKPTLATCTSCHDNVVFAAGPPSCSTLPAETWFEDCLHSGGAITVANANDPASCVGCHGEGASFAVSNFHHGDTPP
jgi:OmcA/MtrC family decaheme c-type cytochrome